MTAFAVDIRSLHKRFNAQPRDVINDLSLALPMDNCLSLLGPSGCGKTTLLRLVMGLEQPSSGSIQIAPALSARMSYVFQEPRLVPWRTTLENVQLPLELTADKAATSADYAVELLRRIGLGDSMQRFPAELSGGMQMRAALARALVTKPRLLLLDEPFAALDERSRFRMQDLLLELKQSLSLQYIFVTHSISEAIYLGNQVLLLDQHGRKKTLQPIAIGARSQDVKLGKAFAEITKDFSQQFAAIEQNA